MNVKFIQPTQKKNYNYVLHDFRVLKLYQRKNKEKWLLSIFLSCGKLDLYSFFFVLLIFCFRLACRWFRWFVMTALELHQIFDCSSLARWCVARPGKYNTRKRDESYPSIYPSIASWFVFNLMYILFVSYFRWESAWKEKMVFHIMWAEHMFYWWIWSPVDNRLKTVNHTWNIYLGMAKENHIHFYHWSYLSH